MDDARIERLIGVTTDQIRSLSVQELANLMIIRSCLVYHGVGLELAAGTTGGLARAMIRAHRLQEQPEGHHHTARCEAGWF